MLDSSRQSKAEKCSTKGIIKHPTLKYKEDEITTLTTNKLLPDSINLCNVDDSHNIFLGNENNMNNLSNINKVIYDSNIKRLRKNSNSLQFKSNKSIENFTPSYRSNLQNVKKSVSFQLNSDDEGSRRYSSKVKKVSSTNNLQPQQVFSRKNKLPYKTIRKNTNLRIYNDRDLLKFKNVFDSMEESEEEKEELELSSLAKTNINYLYIFHEDSKIRKLWDFVMFIIIIHSTTFNAYNLAFLHNGTKYSGISYMDIYFVVEIIIRFFTYYKTEQMTYVYNFGLIAQNYLKGMLIIDIFNAIPVENLKRISNYKLLDDLNFIALNWFIIFSRFAKLSDLRCFKMKFIEDLEVRKMTSFCILSFFYLHLCSCIFIQIGYFSYNYQNISWLKELPPNYSNFMIYITSLHFHIVTTLAVGYGDITARSSTEKIYCILLMIVGISAYSFLISFLSYIFSKDDKSTQRYNLFRYQLREMLLEYSLDGDLYLKLAKKKILGRYELIEELPSSLKTELIISINKEFIDNFNLFEDKSTEFIIYLLPQMQPLIIYKNDIIFNINEVVDEMYIVSQGLLSINLGKSYNFLEVYELKKNMNFGEIMMYSSQPSNLDLSCKSEIAELFSIQKETLLQLKMRFEIQVLNMLKKSLDLMKIIEFRKKALIELFNYEEDNKKLYQLVNNLDFHFFKRNFNFYF